MYRGDSWIPQRMQRTAVELRHMEATDVASPGKMKGGKGPRGIELQASNHGAALMSNNRWETAHAAAQAWSIFARRLLLTDSAASIAPTKLPQHLGGGGPNNACPY